MMLAAGTICEFNPFHNGHKKIIDALRSHVGKDGCVICVMSGHVMQRGSFPIADKYVRAQMALSCGADLVVELPFPWSMASSENYASCGVTVLKRLSCGELIFGSECGDITLLENASRKMQNEYSAFLQHEKGNNPQMGDSALYAQWLDENGFSFGPNDRLGIAYLNALPETMKVFTVRRDGNYYDSSLQTENPSASAIRKARLEGNADWKNAIPEKAVQILENAGTGSLSDDWTFALGKMVLAYYRIQSAESLNDCYGMNGGLADRICRMAADSDCFDTFFESLRTKRYTDSHLRRTLLSGLLHVTKEDMKASPAYTTLLAADGNGISWLSHIRKECGSFVLSKPSDVPDTPEGLNQYRLSRNLDALYTLCLKQSGKCGKYFQKSPCIEH